MTARGARAPITPQEAREAVQAVAAAGSIAAAARAVGMTRAAVQRRLRAADRYGITPHGEVDATREVVFPVPERGVARYLLSAVQNNTAPHREFWANLLALAEETGARVMLGRIRYNHTRQQVAQEKDDGAAQGDLWYAPEFAPYICDERVRLAPGLMWAGDMNALPTAANPLSGLDSFTGVDSCIFPHTHLALRSIATAKPDPVKINYTTGAATLANYIKRKAGLKAEFHHAYSGLMVEVDAAGDWFVRQVNADRAGVIHDLDARVEGGRVTRGHRVAVFTPGDIHGERIDQVVAGAVWGAGGMVDVLRPRAQVLHDVFNMGRRSHHLALEERLALHFAGRESVESEVEATAAELRRMVRPWAETFVVKSNHDEHLDRWVRESDWRADPVNAHFYLAAALAKVEAIRDGREFDLVAWAIARAGGPPVRFLRRDEPLTIAGIDHAHHGDLGPNGARGSAAALARIGRRSTIGHSHGANIVAGCYQVGVSCELCMGYNRGPSNWSHTHALTYDNGKRALVTMRGAKWRGE
ncbi:hypothetical protein [Oceanicella actignis]|uniref:Uncharacterized protein n=1 Tax=Oceanicella actignis TaxID=1189325 RepID=A0A1M7U194_9RHOB|nr:hypothetical protein [Oceanicella actignis]SES77387.1 hypothetical protein SAMN04488119_101419 [Oceanicella actignis]SHN76801.1 hypothetical protein SAMN05216200_1143 [Oceanicella actignis]